MQIDPSDTAGTIGQAIRSARRERQLTQEDLAVAAGVSVRLVHELEAGKATARLDTLVLVLAALGLEIDVVPRRRR